MNRTARLVLLWTAALLCVAGAALAIAWARFVPNDQEVAQRIVAQAEARLGVKVSIGAARLKLWPQPELVIEDARTVQPEPIVLKRLVAQARLLPLLRGRVEVDAVLVDGATLPQLSLRGLRVRPAAEAQADTGTLQVARLDFRDVVWITRHGLPLEFSGNAQFGPDWELRQADVVRPGVQPAVHLALTPLGSQHWKVAIEAGGGSANGEMELRTAADGSLALTGKLAPRGIDVAAALAGFKRHSALRGKASGETTLSAKGASIGELARSLHTRTLFTMAAPTLLHIDVDKAIRSFGQERAGQTALLSLTGQMDTQNGPDGMVVRYTALDARGQTFSATGQGSIANRRIDGELTVQLAGGLVGVPLKVTGPLKHPQVSVPASAVAGATAGAVIGTAVLPGIGTAIGASVGAAVGKLFGGGTDANRKAAPGR
jgi:uncharacterized protein involved in outer membrane biogenesis